MTDKKVHTNTEQREKLRSFSMISQLVGLVTAPLNTPYFSQSSSPVLRDSLAVAYNSSDWTARLHRNKAYALGWSLIVVAQYLLLLASQMANSPFTLLTHFTYVLFTWAGLRAVLWWSLLGGRARSYEAVQPARMVTVAWRTIDLVTDTVCVLLIVATSILLLR
jgi:hypothetical protein